MPARMFTQVIGPANNLMAHLGDERRPAWWVRAPIFRGSNTATSRGLHHTPLNGDHSLFTRR